MAIRLPRATRRPRRTRVARDIVIIVIAATVVMLFAARTLLSLLSIETWTAAWKIVELPTSLLVSPLERVDALTQTPAGDLTLATIVATTVCSVAAMITLGTLANRRD